MPAPAAVLIVCLLIVMTASTSFGLLINNLACPGFGTTPALVAAS